MSLHRLTLAPLLCAALFCSQVQAKVEKIEILRREVFANGTEFGPAGAYEKLRGRVSFVLDANLAANASIADLKLAPHDDRSLVDLALSF